MWKLENKDDLIREREEKSIVRSGHSFDSPSCQGEGGGEEKDEGRKGEKTERKGREDENQPQGHVQIHD